MSAPGPGLGTDVETTNPPGGDELGLRALVLLAYIAAASPLAFDLYLASFPAIARDLGTTPELVQLTLTAYLAGIAIGQPLWGPLSDRFGRRRLLIVSNALTVVASIAVVLSPTIEFLITARFGQALCAASGMVIARAMVSDLVEGFAAVRALSLMMTVHAVVPVLAPVVGGVLATFLPWRAVLAVFAAIVASQLIVAVLLVRETLPPERRATRVAYGDLARVARRPDFLVSAVTVGLGVGVMMTFVVNASFVYQDELGMSPVVFGLGFALNATAMIVGGLVSARLARAHVHPARTISLAFPGAVASALAIVVVAMSPWPYLLVGPVVLTSFFMNLVFGNAMGLAMEQARGLTGAGSAVLGLAMFGVSAAVTPLAGVIDASAAVAMGLAMALLGVVGAGVFAAGRVARARTEAATPLGRHAGLTLDASAPRRAG